MNSKKLLNFVLGRQLKEMRRNARRLSGRYEAEAVHDLRVAALRADFALKFFSVSRSDIMKTRDGLKKVRAVLGNARNLDILLGHARKNLKKLHAAPSQIKGITSLINSQREISRQALLKTLKSRTYAGVVKGLEQIKSRHRVTKPGALIGRSFRKTIAGLLEYHKQTLSGDDYHKVRIAFKKVRYACEFLESLDKSRMQKALKFIQGFLDLLGDRQDSIAAIEILSEMSHDQVNKLIRMEKMNIDSCEKRFRKLGGELFDLRSKMEKLYRWAD